LSVSSRARPPFCLCGSFSRLYFFIDLARPYRSFLTFTPLAGSSPLIFLPVPRPLLIFFFLRSSDPRESAPLPQASAGNPSEHVYRFVLFSLLFSFGSFSPQLFSTGDPCGPPRLFPFYPPFEPPFSLFFQKSFCVPRVLISERLALFLSSALI